MFNKIRNPFCISTGLFVIFSTAAVLSAAAQDSSYTRPSIVDKWSSYQQQVKEDSTKRMIELKTLIPAIVYDLRYATTNNFMHRRMYPANTSVTFLRLPVALALQKVEEYLSKNGLGLKIFDAYRPFSVTEKFWELVKDERYVANPAKGSGHNRGIAVDLTLIHLKDGSELPMGTGFDNFSDTAHQTFQLLPAQILQNRSTLRTVMEKYGFKAFETEWWHFYWGESSRFELLDIDFKTLNKRF